MNLGQLNSFLKSLMLNIELMARLFYDSRISLLTKILFVVLYSVYLVFPLDLIPDFLPAIGQIDEVVLFFFFMLQFINACPQEIVNEHKSAILNGDWKISIFKYLTGGQD